MGIIVVTFGQDPLILLQVPENKLPKKKGILFLIFFIHSFLRKKDPHFFCCTEIFYFFPLLTRNLPKKVNSGSRCQLIPKSIVRP